jgi:biopolymer transport protein ExbB
MEYLLQQLGGVWTDATRIWADGGWAMPALAFVALVMFAMGVHIRLKLREKGIRSVPEKTWRRWIDRPSERRGPVGQLLSFVTAARTLKETAVYFDEIRATEIAPLKRDLLIMRICVGVAPLLGLLGTVTGMLTTFDALSTGSGGDKTMGMIAGGISEALITTETGLVIALPGLFLQHMLARHFDRYRQFLAHLETVCNQTLYRKLHSMRAAG